RLARARTIPPGGGVRIDLHGRPAARASSRRWRCPHLGCYPRRDLVRVRILILTAAILAPFAVRDAAAQGIPCWSTKQFSFERIDAERVRLMREAEIEGDAGTPNAGQKFFADDLVMNLKTGELVAEGNVVFQTPTTSIFADTGVFNTKHKARPAQHATRA